MKLVSVAITLAFAAGCVQRGSGVRVWDNTSDDGVSEGETVLGVDPRTAYSRLADLQSWPSIFPDVARIDVASQQGTDARATIVRANGHVHAMHFHREPETRTVWFEELGGRALVWGDIAFVGAADSRTTRAHLRFHASIAGTASLLINDDKLRVERRRRVADDLAALRAHFGAPPATR